MNTTLNTISDSKREVVITISEEEFSKFYNETLGKYRSKIKMAGFRPGKVPTNIIKMNYGQEITFESDEAAVNANFGDFINNNKNLHMVGRPVIMDIKVEDDKSHTYKVEFEVIPEFELGDYKSLTVEEPVHVVNDEEVEKALKDLSYKMAERTPIDQINDFDVHVIVDSYGVKDDTKEIDLEKPIDKHLPLELNNVDFKDLFLNAKVDSQILYEYNDGKSFEYFVVKEIYKVTPAVIDEEFIKKVSNNKFDNLEDYKQEITFVLQKQWDDRSREELKVQVYDKLIDMHSDFTIPETLLNLAKEQLAENFKKQKVDLNNKHIKEYIESQSDKLTRIEIILNKIVEKEDIKVEDFDIENFIDKYYAQYFGPDFDKAPLVQNIRKDEQALAAILKEKVVDFILDFTTTEEIDFEEYDKKIREEVDKEIAEDKIREEADREIVEDKIKEEVDKEIVEDKIKEEKIKKTKSKSKNKNKKEE